MCFVGFCAEKIDNWAFVSTVELPATMMIWEESKGLVTKQGWDSLQVNIQFFICLNSPRKIKNGTLTEMNIELDAIGLGILKLQTTLWMNHPAFYREESRGTKPSSKHAGRTYEIKSFIPLPCILARICTRELQNVGPCVNSNVLVSIFIAVMITIGHNVHNVFNILIIALLMKLIEIDNKI